MSETIDDIVYAEVDAPPTVQCFAIDGGYYATLLSQAGDPDANNMAERVKTRVITAHDTGALQIMTVSCLISDFGMSQEDAELVQADWMVAGEPPSEVEGPDPEPEPAPDPDVPEQHERVRDEHGRFVHEQPQNTTSRDVF